MAKPRVPKKTNPENGAPIARAASTALPAGNGNAAAIETAAPKPSTRKPTIVKSDIRPNLVPINLEDEVRSLAYLLAERRGFEPGHDAEDWLEAEREVRQRYHQQSA